MILYRADQKGRKTRAEDYALGLWTKQLGSGDDPEPHTKYGWLKTIKAHIQFDGKIEEFIYDTTAFLSFTTDINVCNSYLATKKKLSYFKTTKQEAEAYIFTFSVDLDACTKLGPNFFLFSFNCNYDKINNDVKFGVSPMLAPFIKCNICEPYGKNLHNVILINAAEYLKQLKDIYPLAFANAINSKEWLLLPADPMVGGPHNIGLQSKIPIADCWDVEFYRYDK